MYQLLILISIKINDVESDKFFRTLGSVIFTFETTGVGGGRFNQTATANLSTKGVTETTQIISAGDPSYGVLGSNYTPKLIAVQGEIGVYICEKSGGGW